MLSELVVENLGPIRRAELSPAPGCSVLTGETGAGKTLMVAGLSLLLGERSDTGLVRAGASEARIEGRFVLPAGHSAAVALEAHGIIEAEHDGPVEMVVTRVVGTGAGKARINGRLVPARILAEIGRDLVEIAGQNEHQRVGTPTWQRRLLDEYAGPEVSALARDVGDAVRACVRARTRLSELQSMARARARELDLLDHEIAEIERVEISPGESDDLAAEAARLANAEALAAGLGRAVERLRGEGGAGEQIADATSSVAELASIDAELSELATRLESLALEAGDVADELRARVVEADSDRLEAIRSRRDAITRLLRKYGATEAEVLEYLERAHARRDQIGADEGDVAELEGEVDEAAVRARELADRLSKERAAAAPRLAAAVSELLAELAMPDSLFAVELTPRELYEGGVESVEFAVSTGPGETPRPVARVASGGELSRIALALHLLTTNDSVATMVFDEVDAGVGGSAARSVGRALAQLAARSGAQVLVVTHLPQVAAFADAHYRISKETSAGRSEAMVTPVEGDERIEELSRMLAGLPDSERAREHAQELLELAGEVRL